MRIDHLLLSPTIANRLVDAGVDRACTRLGKGKRSRTGVGGAARRAGGCVNPSRWLRKPKKESEYPRPTQPPTPAAGQLALDAALLNGLIAKWSYRCGLRVSLASPSTTWVWRGKRTPSAPLTVAFASDFHAGPRLIPVFFPSLFATLARSSGCPLLGGDFVRARRYANELADGLVSCRPPCGKYACSESRFVGG